MFEALFEFPEGWGGVLEKIPFVGEVWIFSGITQFSLFWIRKLMLHYNFEDKYFLTHSVMG